MSIRTSFYLLATLSLALVLLLSFFWSATLFALALVLPVTALGLYDVVQKEHAVLRNFPVIGHFRYWLEMIRPEINQYFIESDTDGVPFNRELRSLVYQRAKGETDTLPFGTRRDLYEPGYEWMHHSLAPAPVSDEDPRVMIGESTCSQPYSCSVYNIAAMSFGALSQNAIRALSGGAKLGGFAHNTGEGGISPHHLEPGGDLIWQIGTGYFGCRNTDGRFDAAAFSAMAERPNVKMIEVKLSQGAKPGHGGILPGKKVSEEIAAIRLVEAGKTVVSPPAHSEFSTPRGLLDYVVRLRELSGGKPVGFKLCVGDKGEFAAICKAMLESGQHPDFISVDGAEGGTGAAPLEFSNSLGMPLVDGLVFVHNLLTGCGMRDKVKLNASGKIVTGFHLATKIALGADWGSAARGMMFALGCIQALRCNHNDCPVGVATQNPDLVRGLAVEPKTLRVARFHEATVKSLTHLLAAAGLTGPGELKPWHVYRRISETESRHLAQIYPFLEPGQLLGTERPKGYVRCWQEAQPDRW